MSVLKLVSEKDKCLKVPTEKYNFSNDEITKKLCEDLIETMDYYNGLGLSANQVGLPYSVFSMVHDNNKLVIFNPEILETSEETINMEEGCLSFKHLYIKISRPAAIVVKFQDAINKEYVMALSGMSARIFQHEFDHLNGKTFDLVASKFYLDRAKRNRKQLMRKNKNNH